MKLQDMILLNQMEIHELRRELKNPIYWLLIRKDLELEIEMRLSIIDMLEEELLQEVPESHLKEISEVKKFAHVG